MSLKKIALTCMAFTLATLTWGQVNNSNEPLYAKPARSLYGEIGGPGIFSINYDRRFRGEKGLGFRAGAGGIGFLNEGVFTVPVGLNHLSGKDGHYLELGAGGSLIIISDGEIFDEQNSTVFGYLNVGYRYQPLKKGFTGRVFLSPIIAGGTVFPFYGGISLGFKF